MNLVIWKILASHSMLLQVYATLHQSCSDWRAVAAQSLSNPWWMLSKGRGGSRHLEYVLARAIVGVGKGTTDIVWSCVIVLKDDVWETFEDRTQPLSLRYEKCDACCSAVQITMNKRCSCRVSNCFQARIHPSWCCTQNRDSSKKTTWCHSCIQFCRWVHNCPRDFLCCSVKGSRNNGRHSDRARLSHTGARGRHFSGGPPLTSIHHIQNIFTCTHTHTYIYHSNAHFVMWWFSLT